LTSIACDFPFPIVGLTLEPQQVVTGHLEGQLVEGVVRPGRITL